MSCERPMVVILLVAAAACSATGGDETPSVTLTDSAGVRIAQHGPLSAVPTLRPVLEWSHGHEESHYTFSRVLNGAVDGDDVVVGDVGSSEVVRVAAGGSAFKIAAARGEGPSEVMATRGIVGIAGGGVWIEDVRNAKLIRVAADSVVEILSTQGDLDLTYGLMPEAVAGDGTLLMTTASYRSDFEHPWLQGSLVRLHPQSRSVDTVGHYPLAKKRSEPENPFDHIGWATGAGEGFVHTRSDIPQATWRADDGRVTQIARWVPENRFPSSETWDAFEGFLRIDLVRVNPRMPSEDVQAFVEREVERYEMDQTIPLPYFGRTHGDQTGRVWLEKFEPGGAWPEQYVMITAEADRMVVVDFDREFRFLDAAGDLVVGVIRDATDVQAVAGFRIPS